MSCNICIDRLYNLLNHENTHWFQSFVSNHGYVLMSSSKDEDDVKLSAMERSDMSSRYWLYERYRQQRWSTGQRRRGGFSFFLSGWLVNVTWLPDIHPSLWIMSVSGSKRPCVDLWSRLTSSTHLCKRAWLGHCMITWPCCRFITLSLSSWWAFLSRVKHILYFFAKKKGNHDKNSWKCSLPCISDSLQCSFFLCVTSQYSKIYTVNDFQ